MRSVLLRCPKGLSSKGRRATPATAIARSIRSRQPASATPAILKGFTGATVAPALSAAARCCGSVATPAKTSALAASAQRLRDAINNHEVIAEIATAADAPVDKEAALERIRHELREVEEELEVLVGGEALVAGPGRRSVTIKAPLGPDGGAPLRTVSMQMPTTEDVQKVFSKWAEENPRVEKAEELADILDKYLTEKYIGQGSKHVALLAAWGPKVYGDASGEFAEVAALMDMQLRAFRAALKATKEDFQFEVHRAGDGKNCLVMPPSNFALLALKDAFHMLLQGFRVILVVQPRFLPHFLEVQKDFAECGLPSGLLEVMPGITPEADPEVLHEVLRVVDRLQFTGSSAMFKSLVAKAYDLGNLRMEHAGEVSGLNKVRLDGVSVTHPAAAAGTAWASMGNNGELCTSASLVEFDPATGDTPQIVKETLEGHAFRFGRDPLDTTLNVLLKDGVTTALEVKTELGPEGFQEWWAKTILAQPYGAVANATTNQSLGHCIYAPSIARALELGTQEDASCIYTVGVPADKSAPSARAGTTGCKLPESVFGGMKSYTNAVAGDHDGVGSIQTLLNTVKRRGANWRDSEEAHSQYELTETAENLLEFLNPNDQQAFTKQIGNVLDVYQAFMPQVSKPYNGQSLVGADGQSRLVSLAALRPARKQLLIQRGVGLPDEIVKVAILCEMSPLRELPVDLHLLGSERVGKLRVTDPLKSFVRVVSKTLGWRVHWHVDTETCVKALEESTYPPYFYCVKDKHVLPREILDTVCDKGGYLYEGLPTDALTLFRWLTTTQAWTVACTEDQVEEATAELQKVWASVALREEPHAQPDIIQPKPRDSDIGGGFGATGIGPDDNQNWDDLDSDDSSSSDDSSDSSDDEDDAKKKAASPATPAAADAKTTDSTTAAAKEPERDLYSGVPKSS